MNIDNEFEKILNDCRNDPNVIGLILGGSRGKLLHTKHSDYDFNIIVKPIAKAEYESKLKPLQSTFDIGIQTFDEFKVYAEWGSESMWDRYNYTHVKATIDKTGGEIQLMIDEKGKVPSTQVFGFISANLDEYINQVYRSMKCLRDQNAIGQRLEAATSIRPLLNCLFAIHDNRLCPYFKYLFWELSKFPLYKLPWSADELMEKLLTILETADYRVQQSILKEVERIFRIEGYGSVFDSWEGDDRWTMNYEPESTLEKE